MSWYPGITHRPWRAEVGAVRGTGLASAAADALANLNTDRKPYAEARLRAGAPPQPADHREPSHRSGPDWTGEV